MLLNANAQNYPQYNNNNKDKWRQREWRSANTARFSIYMPNDIRESIRFMNLARMYGEKFSKIYIEPISNKTSYELSLIKSLNRNSYKAPLKPSRSLFASALIHSVHSGIGNRTGESGLKGKLFFFDPFGYGKVTAGNCDYGSKDGLAIALNLLIDSGVPFVSHRKNILDADFTRVGGAQFCHKKHGTNAVFTYSSYNFMDLLYLRKPDNQQLGINVEISHLLDKPMAGMGLTYLASHLRTTQLFADFTYQIDISQQQLHALSTQLSFGSSKDFATNFLVGFKSTGFYNTNSLQTNLTLQPTITWFVFLNLLRNRIVWEINSDYKPAVYRISYGYQMNIAGNPGFLNQPHNLTVSRFVFVKSFNKKRGLRSKVR